MCERYVVIHQSVPQCVVIIIEWFNRCSSRARNWSVFAWGLRFVCGKRELNVFVCIKIFLASSANLPDGLYILPSVISFFFLMISRRQIIWRSAGPIFAIFTSNESFFGCRWSIWTCFFDISRDVAMATDFVQKLANSPLSSLWYSETVRGNAVYGQD